MEFCHQHNLVNPETAGAERRFGIRVTLPPNDTLRKILGDDWERLHWYPTEAERDAAFENMANQIEVLLHYRVVSAIPKKGNAAQ